MNYGVYGFGVVGVQIEALAQPWRECVQFEWRSEAPKYRTAEACSRRMLGLLVWSGLSGFRVTFNS